MFGIPVFRHFWQTVEEVARGAFWDLWCGAYLDILKVGRTSRQCCARLGGAYSNRCSLLSLTSMAFLEKFRAGAQKAAIQATAFAKDSSTKVASGSRDFVQGFSLPGEADKAAKILDSFLGLPNSA